MKPNIPSYWQHQEEWEKKGIIELWYKQIQINHWMLRTMDKKIDK